MQDWVQLKKKPANTGTSRCFIIDKDKIRLEANTVYVIRIIPERNFYEDLTQRVAKELTEETTNESNISDHRCRACGAPRP